MSAITTIDLLRHGETTVGSVYLGSTDAPLSEIGWQQLWRATARQKSWQQIVSSPLRRCVDFARQLAERRGVELVVKNELREIDFGVWDGLSAEEIYANDAEQLTAFWANPTLVTPPGGESWRAFHSRVLGAWREVVNEFTGQNVLLVSHAGVQRLILSDVLGLDAETWFRVDVPHACRSRLSVSMADSIELVQHGVE